MNYKNVTDKEYKGFDITIYERNDNYYAVDVKESNGLLLYGWDINDIVALKVEKIKPVWVQVFWSESGEFEENELVYFPKFENRAYMAAMKHSPHGGYYKTKVNVLFDNGDEYACRLDLAPDDTMGFEDHAKQLIEYYENQEDDSAEQDYIIQMYKANYEFLKQVDWTNV